MEDLEDCEERFHTIDGWLPLTRWYQPTPTTHAIVHELERRKIPKIRFTCRMGQRTLYPLQNNVWFEELFWVQDFFRNHLPDQSARYFWSEGTVLAHILYNALDVPNGCPRRLEKGQSHHLFFFTNYRAIQIYCWHNSCEKEKVLRLFNAHLNYDSKRKCFSRLCGLEEVVTYDCWTDDVYFQAKPYIAWGCIFPDGVDMEALSALDANAHLRAKQEQKFSKPAAVKPGKEKDHPPPPPPKVYEPPSSDRKNGATYDTGKLLGKGGFAICYEGFLGNKVVALKIVKSYMPQKKMEQKFQTELQIHSKMNHPNIVEFYRAFSYEQCTYIVLELCPNGSLMDMVKKRKYITEPEVRYWTVQMAGAVKYMHGKGIIHRDLKMGNIFLDRHMNVKIGDFGLAALLMSGKDWQACRRTTLCGTPNYIAPEILSKDKSGHDHAVDIWSLGIIIFAMLTGKPPFQSATADEIYRRARAREYDWPKLNTSENFISDETKDLVSQLLQSPEDRPDPDTIVQHPFFTCGPFPQSEQMTEWLKDTHPDPSQFLAVGIRGGKANANARNLKKLCIECDVGPGTEKKRYTSTYRECADEEKAGLTPVVPLAADVVYCPFHQWLEEQAKLVISSGGSDQKAVESLEPILSSSSSKSSEQTLTSRPATQSFAAQQRARPLAVARKPAGENNSSRPVVNIFGRNASRKGEPKISEETVAVENRLVADMVEHLSPAPRKQDKPRPKLISLAPDDEKEQITSLFGKNEKVERIPGTRPELVLEGLRRFQAELERALNSRSVAVEARPPPPPTIVVKWVDYTNKFGLGYILSNHSVGCIFKTFPNSSADPTKGFNYPTCIVVRNGEQHLINRSNPNYDHRHQLVSMNGPNIEFYENRGMNGILRSTVRPTDYHVKMGPDGNPRKLSEGVDEWDNRKRERMVLWKKFSNYMTQYSRDSDFPFDDALKRREQSAEEAAANVVTFYQRLGDVGCWGFCDGHFQFNFPDHTKIVLSADGAWCDFYHLPLEAAHELSVNGTIPANALDDRQHLSYPLQTLLNFAVKPRATQRKRPEISPMIQGVPAANDFRKKIEFIRLIVKEWVTNGGLGISDMSPEGRLRWSGSRETVSVKMPYKHVWVAVGGMGRDDLRKVAWFDPTKPNTIVPDIEP